MEGKRLIESIHLTNFLSFGPDAEPIELQPLNVLIGPNASGKSNLVTALGLLKSTPRSLREGLRQQGWSGDLTWKGRTGERQLPEIQVAVRQRRRVLEHCLLFNPTPNGLQLQIEEITEVDDDPSRSKRCLFKTDSPGVRLATDEPILLGDDRSEPGPASLLEGYDHRESALSQIREPSRYDGLAFLAETYSAMEVYHEWDLGAESPVRQPQRADAFDHHLLSDASNLALVLNNLSLSAQFKKRLLECLRVVSADVEDFSVRIQGGTVQLYLHQRWLASPVPASRLSDGTLRYLCLLAILLHPEPAPLVCLEEPEAGLHPDVLSSLAELLIESSARCQLIVTTHSDSLVSALSEHPEAVLVTERTAGGTRLHRLEPDKLAYWLAQYTLGEVWRIGEIGGNRW